MSRIYVVRNKAGEALRYVRANNLNQAIRAHAHELFEAEPATSEQIWQASRVGEVDVLDSLE